jgi:hypothetical protein
LQKSLGIFRRRLASSENFFVRSFGKEAAISGRNGSRIHVHTSASGAFALLRPFFVAWYQAAQQLCEIVAYLYS